MQKNITETYENVECPTCKTIAHVWDETDRTITFRCPNCLKRFGFVKAIIDQKLNSK